MPNGASLAPFAAESQCYACQTRSVRHNSLPYDTATPVPTSTTSQQQPADSKQPGSPRWQAAAPPPSAKCIRWGEKWVAGIDPKHAFDPNVNISRRERWRRGVSEWRRSGSGGEGARAAPSRAGAAEGGLGGTRFSQQVGWRRGDR